MCSFTNYLSLWKSFKKYFPTQTFWVWLCHSLHSRNDKKHFIDSQIQQIHTAAICNYMKSYHKGKLACHSIADTLFSAHLFIPILQSTVTTFISLLSKFCTSLHLRHLELALTIPARQQGLFWKKESNSLNNHCQVPSFRRELDLSGGWSWVQIPHQPGEPQCGCLHYAVHCILTFTHCF